MAGAAELAFSAALGVQVKNRLPGAVDELLAGLLRHDESSEIAVKFRALYTGLSGRILKAWASPFAGLFAEGSASRGDEAMIEAIMPAKDIRNNLAAHVHPLAASLYERFGVTELSLDRVQAELNRLMSAYDPPSR